MRGSVAKRLRVLAKFRGLTKPEQRKALRLLKKDFEETPKPQRYSFMTDIEIMIQQSSEAAKLRAELDKKAKEAEDARSSNEGRTENKVQAEGSDSGTGVSAEVPVGDSERESSSGS